MMKKSSLVERAGPESQDPDDMDFIAEETSLELKTSDGSPKFKQKGFRRSKSPKRSSIRSRSSGKATESSVEFYDKDRTGKISNKTRGCNDESPSSTSNLTNNGDRNGKNDDNNDNPIAEVYPENRTQELIALIRHKCGVWVNNDKVQITMVCFIVINAIMMGVATFGFVKNDIDLKRDFETADRVFLVIFTIELSLQFVYLGFGLFQDGWLVFDLIIISLSWGLNAYQIVRAFRIFRAFRLVTRVKIMKNLILALFSVMPRMAAIFLMLLLIFYIFAVMFTMLFAGAKDHLEDETNKEIVAYFGSLQDSLMTLFQLMTMDEWATIVRLIGIKYKVTAILFMIMFVIISGFIVVNLIVAVICDAIGALDEKDKAKFHGQHQDEDDSVENLELRDQLDTIEDQIVDLTRIQARTFHTLEYLTQQIRLQKKTTRKDKKAAPSEEAQTEEPKKERRATTMSKERSATTMNKERSGGNRRKTFATLGYSSKRNTYQDTSSKRPNYKDTWKQEGDEKAMRQDMISKFAKSARELQKMREQEEQAEEDSD